MGMNLIKFAVHIYENNRAMKVLHKSKLNQNAKDTQNRNGIYLKYVFFVWKSHFSTEIQIHRQQSAVHVNANQDTVKKHKTEIKWNLIQFCNAP